MLRRPCDPYLDPGLRRWIVKYARKNYWRCASKYGLDDLIQEGMVVFAMCRQKYQVENKAHFMALVKTCYRNLITDLANECSRMTEIPFSQIATNNPQMAEADVVDRLVGSEQSDAEAQAALARAPAEVGALLRLIRDPQMAKELQKPLTRRNDGTRETHSERICRLMGIEYVDFEALLHEVLYA